MLKAMDPCYNYPYFFGPVPLLDYEKYQTMSSIYIGRQGRPSIMLHICIYLYFPGVKQLLKVCESLPA